MTKKNSRSNTNRPHFFSLVLPDQGLNLPVSILAASEATAAIEYDVNYIWRYGNEKIEHDELDIASLTPKNKKHIFVINLIVLQAFQKKPL